MKQAKTFRELHDVENFKDRLIELVKQHELLYNVNDKNYKNSRIRRDVWDIISEELNACPNLCQKTWQNLRHTHIKELKENNMSNGNATKKRRYYPNLSFLENFIQDNETDTNNLPCPNFNSLDDIVVAEVTQSLDFSDVTSTKTANKCRKDGGNVIAKTSTQESENVENFQDQLIELVEQYQILYNVKDKNYKKLSARQTVWENIAKKLNVSPKLCQKYWQNIRNSYIKELKENNLSNGGILKKRKYTRDLSFLKNFIDAEEENPDDLTYSSNNSTDESQESSDEFSDPLSLKSINKRRRNNVIAKIPIHIQKSEDFKNFQDRLVELVKQHKTLYNVNDKNYTKNSIRQAIWNDIGKKLKVSTKLCKNFWQDIQYKYVKELKKETLFNKKGKFAHDLSFLTDLIDTEESDTSYESCSKINYVEDFVVEETIQSSDDLSNSSFPVLTKKDEGNNVTEPVPATVQKSKNDETFHDRLIGIVEQYQIIYNINDKNYKNHSVRQAVWDIIAEKLNVDPKLCQKRWQNIKYNYIKDLRQKNVSNGNETKKRKYKRDPSFLKNFIDVVENDTDNESCSKINSVNNVIDEETIISFENFSDVSLSEPQEKNSRNNAKSETIEICNQFNSRDNLDHIEMYCLSLAEPFKAMDIPERERVKYEFAKILKNAKYNNK